MDARFVSYTYVVRHRSAVRNTPTCVSGGNLNNPSLSLFREANSESSPGDNNAADHPGYSCRRARVQEPLEPGLFVPRRLFRD